MFQHLVFVFADSVDAVEDPFLVELLFDELGLLLSQHALRLLGLEPHRGNLVGDLLLLGRQLLLELILLLHFFGRLLYTRTGQIFLRALLGVFFDFAGDVGIAWLDDLRGLIFLLFLFLVVLLLFIVVVVIVALLRLVVRFLPHDDLFLHLILISVEIQLEKVVFHDLIR